MQIFHKKYHKKGKTLFRLEFVLNYVAAAIFCIISNSNAKLKTMIYANKNSTADIYTVTTHILNNASIYEYLLRQIFFYSLQSFHEKKKSLNFSF